MSSSSAAAPPGCAPHSCWVAPAAPCCCVTAASHATPACTPCTASCPATAWTPRRCGRPAATNSGPTPPCRCVTQVRAVTRDADQFTVTLGDGTTEQARRLLLATGVVDELLPIPGLAELWRRGVFNCPYCDGWEVRNQPLAVLASDPRNLQLALQLTRWSPDVLLCSNGTAGPDDDARRLLDAHKVGLREEPIARLDGQDGTLERIVFTEGEPVARTAAFLHAPTRQRSDLPRQLGCTLLEDSSVMVDDLGQTSVPGVLAIGDMARRPSMPVPGAQVVIAAAEGAIAAVAIDQTLLLQQVAT